MMNTADRILFPHYGTPPGLRPGVGPDDLTLIAADGAEVYAREHVCRALNWWGFGCLADRCERVVSELVSRAVKTTGRRGPVPSDIESREKPSPTLVGVRVCLLDRHVLVEVWDSDQSSPLPDRDKGEYLDDHLTAVHYGCDRWNWYRCGDNAVKVIWAEFRLPQPCPGKPDEPLPRRTAGSFAFPEPEQPITALRDPALLHDVLDGLHRLTPDRGHRGEL